MQELREIVEAIQASQAVGKRSALATVVSVVGSAYRREGAKMWIDETGCTIGTISGGCLEADVAETALQVMETGKPMIKPYVMDEDLVWGLGLGCPGTVEIAIEPIPLQQEEDPALFQWLTAIGEGRPAVLATLLDDHMNKEMSPQRRMFIPENGLPIGNVGDRAWNRFALERGREMFARQRAKAGNYAVERPDGSAARLFLDVYMPPIELMIFGAGHDALPLARMGSQLGMSVTVVDPRPAYNTEERFPGANRLLLDPCLAADEIPIHARTYIVIMNHHLERDRAALAHALSSSSSYIGMLGPRRRCERLLRSLETTGHVWEAERLAHLHNPVGLDIGAETAEEIAFSIITEVLAIRNGHKGGLLRDTVAIHQAAAAATPFQLRSHGR
ncbi:XdhC family protein [Brevibacillus migulae]|uniref:XdhC family protein n=1 Tax=Brevibacillus migulae TaxID=1644114 RepID=UPI00106EC443|nr:XdhC/CoxI family protein [Brevibacillus migulae]